ncbi:1999_t:CDS:10 [Ambispora gerdemannii]|uniref:1999_t:CDS:1 n=1 Tax=Ambispora gerdemannii TaxID=144530 RepID=A0A9N9FSR0_9GLOM|nr:1999_t:CDS:10 [Ambispora gerdemannii]
MENISESTRKNSNDSNFPSPSSKEPYNPKAYKPSHSLAPQDNPGESTSSKIIGSKNNDYIRTSDLEIGEGGNKKGGSVETTPLPMFPLFVLTSSFFFAQFCCAIFWGYMSDKFGRRPILLLGLLGNIITCVSFGTSKTLWWAIGSRSLNGALNGNVGVAKSMLGEITDSTNKASAFSLFGLTWGLGCIRPTIGGYLSHPADHFPSIFGNEFWRYYPYLLPCLVASSVSVTGLVVGYFMLLESHIPNQKSEHKPESEPLLNKKHNNRSGDVESSSSSYGTINPLSGKIDGRQDHNETDCDNLMNKSIVGKCSGETCITDNNSTLSKKSDDSSIVTPTDNRKFRRILRDISPAIPPLISYGMLAFLIIFDEVYTIFAVTQVSDGGLGYRAQDLALSLAIMGFLTLICQFVIYPPLVRRVDPMQMFHIAWFLCIPVYMTFPLINTLKRSLNCYFESEKGVIVCPDQGDLTSERIVWCVLLGTLALRFLSNVILFTSITIAISNTVSREVLGTVNGIGQTTASLARAIGPALGGILWAWSLNNNLKFPFDRHFVFIVMSIIAFIGWLQSYKIARGAERSTTRLHKGIAPVSKLAKMSGRTCVMINYTSDNIAVSSSPIEVNNYRFCSPGTSTKTAYNRILSLVFTKFYGGVELIVHYRYTISGIFWGMTLREVKSYSQKEVKKSYLQKEVKKGEKELFAERGEKRHYLTIRVNITDHFIMTT